jgi:hypothetical protein
MSNLVRNLAFKNFLIMNSTRNLVRRKSFKMCKGILGHQGAFLGMLLGG